MIFLIAFLLPPSFAEVTIDQFRLPKRIEVEGKTLTLNGTAYRKASLFKVKVWFGSLYLESPSSDSESILSSKTKKVIDLIPLYDVSASDSVKGWKLAFDENCAPTCETLKPQIEEFLKSVPAFKKSDRYRYIFGEDGIVVYLNNVKHFSIASPDFARLILSTWIGKKPATEEIKKGMLNGAN